MLWFSRCWAVLSTVLTVSATLPSFQIAFCTNTFRGYPEDHTEHLTNLAWNILPLPFLAKVALEQGLLVPMVSQNNFTVDFAQHFYFSECDPGTAGEEIYRMLHSTFRPVAVVGLNECSNAAKVFLNGLQIPQIPYVAGDAQLAEFSNKEYYPFFARTVSTTEMEGKALARFCADVDRNWRRVLVLTVPTPYEASIADEFRFHLQKISPSSTVLSVIVPEPWASTPKTKWATQFRSEHAIEFAKHVAQVAASNSIGIFVFPGLDLPSAWYLPYLAEAGLANNTYAWLFSSKGLMSLQELITLKPGPTAMAFLHSTAPTNPIWSPDHPLWTKVETIDQRFMGAVDIQVQVKSGQLYHGQFWKTLWNKTTMNRLYAAGFPISVVAEHLRDQPISKLFPLFEGAGLDGAMNQYYLTGFDAMIAMFNGIATMLTNGVAPINVSGRPLMSAIRKANFEGVSGHVAFDKKGDRYLNYSIVNLDPRSHEHSGIISVSKGVYFSFKDTTIMFEPCVFADGTTNPPRDGTVLPCDAGMEYQSRARRCVGCLDGWHSPGADSKCYKCAAGKYSGHNRETCEKCPLGTVVFERWQSQWQEAPCEIATWAYAMVLVLCSLSQFISLISIFCKFIPLRISNIAQLGDRLVVQTLTAHSLTKKRIILVRLAGTGVPGLDSHQKQNRKLFAGLRAWFRENWTATHQVEVLDASRLELRTLIGEVILDPWASSRGALMPSLPGAITSTRTHGLPTFVFSLLFAMPAWIAIIVAYFVLSSKQFKAVVSAGLIGIAMAVIMATVASFYMRICSAMKKSPLEKRLTLFEKQLFKRNPQPKACDRGASRAVALQDVRDILYVFRDFIGDRNAYYLDANIVAPLTKPHKLSFAEICGPMKLSYFVSHYWGTGFSHFVHSLEHHAISTGEANWESLTYWICFLSNNQWSIQEEVGGGDWRLSSFYLALSSGSCRNTCMVLDTHALPLTRAWCLFEVLQTYRLQNDTSIRSFDGLLLCTDKGVLGAGGGELCYNEAVALARRLSTLDVGNATASVKADEDMIKALVQQEGGMRRMNEFIADNMLSSLQMVDRMFSKDMQLLDCALRARASKTTTI